MQGGEERSVRIYSTFNVPNATHVGRGNSAIRFGENASDERGRIGVGPVGMFGLEIGTDLFAGVVGRYALTFERESPHTDFGDQIPFSGDEGPIAGGAMIGQDMRSVQSRRLVQNGKPA